MYGLTWYGQWAKSAPPTFIIQSKTRYYGEFPTKLELSWASSTASLTIIESSANHEVKKTQLALAEKERGDAEDEKGIIIYWFVYSLAGFCRSSRTCPKRYEAPAPFQIYTEYGLPFEARMWLVATEDTFIGGGNMLSLSLAIWGKSPNLINLFILALDSAYIIASRSRTFWPGPSELDAHGFCRPAHQKAILSALQTHLGLFDSLGRPAFYPNQS